MTPKKNKKLEKNKTTKIERKEKIKKSPNHKEKLDRDFCEIEINTLIMYKLQSNNINVDTKHTQSEIKDFISRKVDNIINVGLKIMEKRFKKEERIFKRKKNE